MISELRAVTLVPGLEPNARNAGEKRLAAGGCLQACTGKDRVNFHTGGAPALRPGAIAQSPGKSKAFLPENAANDTLDLYKKYIVPVN